MCWPIYRRAFNLTEVPSQRPALLIVGADLGMELPRALPPFARYVGPLLFKPAHALPPDLADFAEGAWERCAARTSITLRFGLPERSQTRPHVGPRVCDPGTSSCGFAQQTTDLSPS